jgi:PRTRC genetic system protein E
MFRELMPLLKERTVMMTISRVDDATIRVCVIPKRLKEDGKESSEENALCTPLAVTGAIDELDREFGNQVSRYSSSIITLGANFAEIEAAHEEATKALKAEHKKEFDRQRGKSSSTKVPPAEKTSGPLVRDGKPVFGSKDGQAAAETRTLFDPEPPPTVSPSTVTTVEPAAKTEEVDVEAAIATEEPSDVRPPSREGQGAFSYPD